MPQGHMLVLVLVLGCAFNTPVDFFLKVKLVAAQKTEPHDKASSGNSCSPLPCFHSTSPSALRLPLSEWAQVCLSTGYVQAVGFKTMFIFLI